VALATRHWVSVVEPVTQVLFWASQPVVQLVQVVADPEQVAHGAVQAVQEVVPK